MGEQRLHASPLATCTGYALVESVRQQVEELQEEVSRMHCIREGEQEIEHYSRLCKTKYKAP